MILENGVIRTMDASVPVQRALAIAGDRVAGGIGTHETALASPDVVDLGGRCVLPGFTDSHVHFPTWALALRPGSARGRRLAGRGARARRAAVPGVPAGSVLRGFGWRDAEWAAPPTKEALDTVTGNVPAALFAHDYHSLWVNSATLALADGELEVPGGVVERDESGEPTGVLREESAWQFREQHLAAPDDEYVDAMREGLRVAASRGVTAVHDKDGWLGAARFWRRLHEQEALTLAGVAVPAPRASRPGRRGGPAAGARRLLLQGRLPQGVHGRDARLADRAHARRSGVEITSGEQLADIVTRAAAAGWPVAVHAIGDLANREALDAFERTQEHWRPRGLRPRIEHAQCVAEEDLPRYAALGVATSVQFSHAPSDRDLAERFWADRLDGTYAFRTLVESGAVVANGSDAPIEELDPWAGVCAGVLRTLDERPAWRPEQAVTVDQALAATIVTPAWLSGDERRRGKLLPGYFADLVVLDRDPLDCDPSEPSRRGSGGDHGRRPLGAQPALPGS